MTTPTQSWQTPAEPAGPAPGVRFAGHAARLGAYILDAIFITLVASVVMVILLIPVLGRLLPYVSDGVIDRGEVDAMVSAMGPLIAVIVVAALALGIVLILYFPFFWTRSGATPGMKVAGIRVVNDRDGSAIGWGTAFVRLIGMAISGSVFYLGYIWILIDSRRRGWHDLLAGTCVISTR
jgi:uncharacterized RDD family membrane protein YckC